MGEGLAMIHPALIDEVRRLLAEGRLSQREIARQTQVSRGTVSLISRGRRPDYDTREAELDDWPTRRGPMVRCPGCGGWVQAPCRLCRVRGLKHVERERRRVVSEALNDRELVRGWSNPRGG